MSSGSSKKTSSSSPSPSSRAQVGAEETVQVGRLRRAHGVRGGLLVEPLSDVPDRISPGASLLLGAPAAVGESPGPGKGRRRDPVQTIGKGAGERRFRRPRSLTVETAQPHGPGLLVTFEELTDRDEAEALVGSFLEIPASQVPPPEEGTWYHYQLVGCRLVDRREGELGAVVDVLEDGGGDLLVVDQALDEGQTRRLLIPFVERYLSRVDPEAGVIEMDLPDGLVDACASRF